MATAAAAEADDAVVEEAVPKKGKKKLIVILAAVLVLALGGGGAAFFVMKKKAAAAAAAAEEEPEVDQVAAAAEKRKERSKHPPTFMPLDPFVVNLADKESDRFAQIGITLEIEDAKFAEEMKTYMPAIRNGILMVLAHKTSQQLLQREGKVALAREIQREALLPMGIDINLQPAASKEAEAEAEPSEEEGAEGQKGKKDKKDKHAPSAIPVTHVHFSNFIVQ